jgi:excisionase family DNA binding protein
MEASVSLNMAVVPQVWLDTLLEKLQNVESVLTEKKASDFGDEWLESSKAREMLGVSQKTWQTYRDERRIPFAQFGRKIYVKRQDLEDFMNAHYICARPSKEAC